MNKMTIFTIILLLIGLIAYYIYYSNQLPEHITVKNDEQMKIARIAYNTAVISLIGAVISLLTQFINLLRNYCKNRQRQ